MLVSRNPFQYFASEVIEIYGVSDHGSQTANQKLKNLCENRKQNSCMHSIGGKKIPILKMKFSIPLCFTVYGAFQGT